METIKPIKVEGGPAEDPAQDPAIGNPVGIVGREGPKDNCTVVIVCYEGKHHTLTIRGKHVTIQNHTREEIQQDHELKELESSNAACPCTRVQIWGEQGGFEIDP